MPIWRWLRPRTPRTILYRPSAVSLEPFGATRHFPEGLDRAPVDRATLFHDVFHGPGPDEITCMGPPIDRVVPPLDGLRFEAKGVAGPIAVTVQAPRIVTQPCTRVTLRGAGLDRARTVDVVSGAVRVRVPVRDRQGSIFAGRRILSTLSKDNPLTWIRDWAAYHAAVHGTDAVIIYDNGSTAYGLDELAATLAAVPGIAASAVVDWPYPYGASLPPFRANYCQTGMLDHWRRQFAPLARSVLNQDVDELAVGPGSVHDAIETSDWSALRLDGRWVERPGVTRADEARALRHLDCTFLRIDLDRPPPGKRLPMRPKWAAVPARCGDDLEWGVHEVYPVAEARAKDRSWEGRPAAFGFRHFRQISTDWRMHDRWRGEPYDPSLHAFDRELAAGLETAFGLGFARPAIRRSGPVEPAAPVAGPIRLDFAIVCIQRSGSHMLSSALGRHPCLASHGEFGPFVKSGRAYVRQPGRLNFMIVMYNQIEDALALGVDIRALPLIHLTRGLRAVAVSNLRIARSREMLGAAHRAHFHREAEIPVPFSYRPGEDEIATWIEQHRPLVRSVRNVVAKHADHCTVDYAEVTGNASIDRLPDGVSQRVCAFLGVPMAGPLSIGIVKSGGRGRAQPSQPS